MSLTGVRILAFSGSTRANSFNKKLVRIASAGAAQTGAVVTSLDLRDLNLPLYDGDLEAKSGLPEGGHQLKHLLNSHDGFLISSPEYNSSYSAVLKNAIDWASRPVPNEKPLQGFTGKVAVLMSASPSPFGGLRGLLSLRSLLSNIQVIVLPQQVTLNTAHEAFDQSDNLKDPKQQASAEKLGRDLAETIAKLNA